MLGKLMKHEFISTWKVYVLLFALLIGSGIVAGLFAYNIPVMNKLPEALQIILLYGFGAYVVFLVAAAVISVVYYVIYYYRSLYTAEGYLTFTLPATTWEIICSKMLVGYIWQLLTGLCTFASVGIFMAGIAVFATKTGDYDIKEIVSSLTYAWRELLGMGSIGHMIMYIASALIGVAASLLIVFFAISLGQLWAQHKIFGSILAFFVIRFCIGMVSTMVSIGTGAVGLLFDYNATVSAFMQKTLLMSIIINLLVVVCSYVGSSLVTNYKLNLD